jgi:hypothetical protein
MASRSLVATAVLIAAFVACASSAHAQNAPPREDPDALFNQANSLMDQGKNAEACPLLERSLAIDPALGTRLNLAICYEKTERLASAYRLFREVAQTAHDTGKAKREEEANEHLAALKADVSHASVVVDDPSADIVVRIDGAEIAKADYAFVPLDKGDHTVNAIASRKQPFSAHVVVASSRGETHAVRIPVLAEEIVVEHKVETVNVTNTRRTVAFIAGGVGVAGVITAAVTGALILSAESTAKDHCTRVIAGSSKLGCDSDGADAVNRGDTLMPINAVAWGVGVVGLAVGAYLFFTSPSPQEPSRTAKVDVVVTPAFTGLTGRF